MTLTWILLSLFFGFSLISGAFGDDQITRELLQSRIEELDLAKAKFITNLTEHGLDLFADHYNRTILFDDFYRKLPDLEPKDFERMSKRLDSIEIKLISLRKFSLTYDFGEDEMLKSAALYLNAIIDVTGMNDSRAETLKNDVAEMITIEIQLDIERERINPDGKGNEKLLKLYWQHNQKQSRLRYDIGWTFPRSGQQTLGTNDFFDLENRVNAEIQLLRNGGNMEMADKIQQLLKNFLSTNIELNRKYPIDSHTKMDQYFEIAHQHYRQYVTLKNIFKDN